MAQLAAGEDSAASARAIPAHVQLLAVAWLRWRIFANGFRRQPTGTRQVIGLVFAIVLRLILWPLMALWIIGPAIACGVIAWLAIAHHRPESLAPLLAGIFLLWQFVSINGLSIAATISSFDPASLMRFPLPFGRYLLLRLLLGLLTPSTIAGCLALFATAIGIGVGDVSLALPSLAVLTVYAWMNILFTRTLAVWLDRWLATRRTREIFSAIMVLFFVSIQMVNLHRASSQSRNLQGSWMLGVLHGSEHVLRWLPPGFAANAIVLKGHPLAAVAQFAALLACTGLFLAVFSVRLHKQFLGEYLSEGAARPAPTVSVSSGRRSFQATNAVAMPVPREPARSIFSPVIAACLRKEWVYLRGNVNMLIGMLTPLIFVVILSKGIFASHPGYFLPGALGYVLFGLVAALYNIFGADAAGVQLYLLAPVRLRDVVLAKNIASLTLILVEAVLAWTVVLVVSKTPIPLPAQISAGLWMIFVVASNLALGTLRSIQAPRRFVPGQTRQSRTPTNRTSGLLVAGLLFGSILLQIPVTLLGRHFGRPWLGAMIFGPLAAAAIAAYLLLLRNADQFILRHRDIFAEELCRS